MDSRAVGTIWLMVTDAITVRLICKSICGKGRIEYYGVLYCFLKLKSLYNQGKLSSKNLG